MFFVRVKELFWRRVLLIFLPYGVRFLGKRISLHGYGFQVFDGEGVLFV